MDINEIPRGQLSTIILTSLLTGDKYGYEIINDVEQKTGGEVVIKKPSLYSSLSRMEKQDLISSYWKDSDIGGRRHYYRLTDYGRKQVLQWQEELLKSQTKVSKILQKANEKQQKQDDENIVEEEKQDFKGYILHQENIFNLTKNEDLPNLSLSRFEEKSEPKEKKTDDFIQYDMFSASSFLTYPSKPLASNPSLSAKNYLDNQQNNLDHKIQESIEENIVEVEKPLQNQTNQDVLDNQFEIDYEALENRYFKTEEEPKPKSPKGEPMIFNIATFENAKNQNLQVQVEQFEQTQPDLIQEEKQEIENVKFEDKKLERSPSQPQNNFDIEEEFNKYQKLTPSYLDTQRSFKVKRKQTPTYSFEPINLEEQKTAFIDNYIKPKFDNNEQKDIEPNEEILKENFQENKDQNTTIQNTIEDIKETEKQPEIHISEKLDDAVLITDVTPEEYVPKVKKIAPISYLHVQAQRYELKDRSNVNPNTKFENQNEQQDNEIIQVYDPDETYSALKDYYQEKNIKLKIYQKNQPLLPSENEIKINKLKFLNALIFLILSLIEIGTTFFITNHFSVLNKTNGFFLLGFTLFSVIYFLTYLLIYLNSPEKYILKSNIKQIPVWIKLVCISVFCFAVYYVNTLFGMTIENVLSYLATFVLPCTLVLNFLIIHFVKLFKIN